MKREQLFAQVQVRVELDFTRLRAPATEVRDDLTAAGSTGGVNPASPPKVGWGGGKVRERGFRARPKAERLDWVSLRTRHGRTQRTGGDASWNELHGKA
eukprot:scaffold9778_cov111-Isochrysis_galbana.AAC.6